MGVGGHQQRLAREVRVRVLTVDFLEALGGRHRLLLLIQEIETLIVELVGRLFDESVFF